MISAVILGNLTLLFIFMPPQIVFPGMTDAESAILLPAVVKGGGLRSETLLIIKLLSIDTESTDPTTDQDY